MRRFTDTSTVILGLLFVAAIPVPHVAASLCSGFFSTAPSVCGSASLQGGFNITLRTESPNPVLDQISGAGVTVGAVGAGTGIFGSVQASANFGVGHVFASATSTFTSPSFDNFQSRKSEKATA
jgi:hypothetical protein